MKNDKHTFFPITINYNGLEVVTKALKYAYTNQEVLYKVVLSSSIAAINQCWFSKIGSKWQLVMGGEIDPILSKSVIAAIETYEKAPLSYPVATADVTLKSA